MKKLFLIPLMALFSCVMAFATVHTAGTYDELKAAIGNAQNGDEIQLTADIAYPAAVVNGSTLNITKSITLNGQGHSLTGYGKRSNGSTCAIVVNDGEASTIDVVIKNITVEKGTTYPINVRSKVHSLTIENAVIDITNAIKNESYNQGLTIGGTAANVDPDYTLTITNTTINNGYKHYPIIFWVPVKEVVISNSSIMGWCSLYFKPGTNGTQVTATNTTFDAQNYYSGKTNSFGAFVLEDNGIDITLDNCVVDSRTHTENSQAMFLLSEWMLTLKEQDEVAFTQDRCSMTITGDNSQILGQFFLNSWVGTEADCPVLFTIKGGTYFEEDITAARDYITIPEGYEAAAYNVTNNGVATTLYRVRKTITTSNSINDNVEDKGAGQNENTEFLISADETVAAESTVANYVEVSSDATLTIPSGKTLEVTNGLDVTDGATLVVEAGSTLVVGEGGVTSEDVESIVITADENGSASFLLDPKVIVNTTPNLTVKMTAKQVGHVVEYGEDTYYWFRFAAPLAGIEAVEKVPARGTYFYKWNYAANEWGSISALSELTPFQGYSLTTEHEGLEDVTYTFKGQLAGNQNMSLDFKSRGYNYFGNSYTGYIDVHALVAQLMENENIDGTIYLVDNEGQGFYPVTLGDITSDPVEVAPMQTFILRQINTGEAVSTNIIYASAIWGNPRYGKVSTPAVVGAPARYAKANNVSRMNIVVTAANGKKDYITLKEADQYSNDFEKGFDALKYMNERTVNLYTTIDGENYGIVATDNLEGMKLNFQTVNEIAYTLSFNNINDTEYAIRDNVTGKVIAIEEGTTYDFAAQPNSTVEGRFEIVKAAKVTTAIENTEVKANVKGIYTITGQYLGENFDVLPAGVYVVDGVKIVK